MKTIRGRLSALALFVAVAGCDPSGGDDEGGEHTQLDARVVTHVVRTEAPTAEGLAYIEAVARIHGDADAAATGDDAGRMIAALRRGLALPVPAKLAEAEVLRLELAARLAESLAQRPEGVAVALDILEPMLATERSLPRDRATARALVTLGDLAVAAEDDALAAGSYARAIRVMSSLRKELER